MQQNLTFLPEIVELRHKLHSLAERSGEEHQTSAAVGEFLSGAGPDRLLTGVAGTGIIATWDSGKEGPDTVFRSELDALPIPEQNDFPYRSRNEETGHKCGHDGHMAILCGVGRHLARQPPRRGRVHLLFQPAEETGQGARAMIESGEVDELQPDGIFALHNLPGYEQNQVVVRRGVFAAGSCGFIARMQGATSHAGHPEQGRSPALAMAQLVESLSAMPQFFVPPEQPAKVTVIHASLGERAFGTSPGRAEVMATLRAFDEELLKRLLGKAEEVARGLATAHELEAEVEQVERFIVTENDDKAVTRIAKTADRLQYNLLEKEEPFPWSEDFGHFTARYPGALFGLGSGTDHPSLHDAAYDFPDGLLEPGIRLFAGLADDLNGSGQP
ncbi:MAG: amidohydrolase [Balneolaceae bacterium]|nr:amidohydrolase [Balneolaceae bacterium]